MLYSSENFIHTMLKIGKNDLKYVFISFHNTHSHTVFEETDKTKLLFIWLIRKVEQKKNTFVTTPQFYLTSPDTKNREIKINHTHILKLSGLLAKEKFDLN